MSKFVATFDGAVVAEPEKFEAGSNHGVRFPVYVNERKKDQATGDYKDTGNTAKIKVTLWNDLADNTEVYKNDIVEIAASLTEREYDKKDGTKGRELVTTFVDSLVLKYRKEGAAPAADDSDLPW